MQQFPDEEEYKKLREACEKWGCFRMVNHLIPLSLMEEMKMVVRSLLDLPMDVKKRNVDVIEGSGYVPPTATNPLYEALGLYDLGSSLALHHFCSQLDALPHQRFHLIIAILLFLIHNLVFKKAYLLIFQFLNRQIIEAYGKAVHELAVSIAEKMGECVGIEGVDFKDWPCQFRINEYNFNPETVGSSGVQVHTDSGFLTIVQDDEHVGGL